MLCKNCGAQLSENAQFCSYCGTKIETAVPLPVEPSPPETTEKNAKKAQSEGTGKNKKAGKIIIIVVCVLAGLALAGFGISKGYTAYVNKPENKFKRTTENFLKEIEAGKYGDAKNLLIVDGNVDGSFEDFSKAFLKGASLTKKGNNYILKGKEESYTLKSNKTGDKIETDDFFMEYNVKTSSYTNFKTYQNYTSEQLDDGMTLYTIKAYKSHEFETECCVAWGTDVDASAREAHITVTTDDNYKPLEITDQYLAVGSSNKESYSGAYIDDDGTIVYDTYYLSKEFSNTLAKHYEDLMSGMAASALLYDNTFDDFYGLNKLNMFYTDLLQDEYNNLAKEKRMASQINKISVDATNWNYPSLFSYSNGNCILNITSKMTVTNKYNRETSSTNTCYVLFKLGKDNFKIFAFAAEQSDLYDAKIITSSANIDTDKMEDWQKAYVDFLSENQKDIGHVSIGYLNDDNVPELFVCDEKDPSHACGVSIYSYIDGSVDKITADGQFEFGSYGSLVYYERTGVFWSNNSGNGSVYDNVYKWDSGNEAAKTISLLNKDFDRPDQEKYYINDQEVSKEEYDKAFADAAPVGVDDTLAPEESTVSDVLDKIANW